MKTAFIFPGQGAQYVGMAMDMVETREDLKQVLLGFDESHQTNLFGIMKEGPEEALKETKFTQPAILFHSIACLEIFKSRSGLNPDFVAGHSLGEFSALVASGVLKLEDAMHIVHKRGEFMITANSGVPFAMSAIIGLDGETVKTVCIEASEKGMVRAVNFNTPIQTVISGTAEGVAYAGELLKAKGAKRVLPLVVGGPFHTPLIDAASGLLEAEMQKFSFVDSLIPVVSNLDALPSIEGEEIRNKLVKQIISPVRWVECVEYIISQGVERFIEFGPQKVLSGMIKNINKDVMVHNIDKLADIEPVLSELA